MFAPPKLVIHGHDESADQVVDKIKRQAANRGASLTWTMLGEDFGISLGDIQAYITEKMMVLVHFPLDDASYNVILRELGHKLTWVTYLENRPLHCVISIYKRGEDAVDIRMGTFSLLREGKQP